MLVGGRGKAGGIKLADDAGRRRGAARAILGIDIKGHTVRRVWVEEASDIAARVLLLDHLRPRREEPLVMLSAMGGMDIEEVAVDHPGGPRPPPHRPARSGFQAHRRAPAGLRTPASTRSAIKGVVDDPRQALRRRSSRSTPCWSRSTRWSSRGDGSVVAARRQGHDRRQRPLPASGPRRRCSDVVADRPAGADGAGAGRHLREARRRRRHPRQRRRARDEHARRGRPGGGRPANFLDVGGGVEGRRDRDRARGAPLRRQGQGAAVQHLRRHHPLRRGRRGPADGARAARHRRADRGAPRRHQRGGGPRSCASARPRTSWSRRPCSTGRATGGRAGEGGRR